MKKQATNERFFTTISTFSIIFIMILGCKKKPEDKLLAQAENYQWVSAMSSPLYCPIDGPHVYFFSNGKLVNSTESLTGIGTGGWAFPIPGRSVSQRNNFYPDSLFLSYGGLNTKKEMCLYEGGAKLPTYTIKKYFDKGAITRGKGIKDHRYITAGMAPGGRVCVWVDNIEIARFKIAYKETYAAHPVIFGNKQTKIDVANYLKYFPIKYSDWEIFDPQYEVGFGFCRMENEYKFNTVETVSKEGCSNLYFKNYVPSTDWNQPYGKPIKFSDNRTYQSDNTQDYGKMQLPVMLIVSWKNTATQEMYKTNVKLPDNFAATFSKPYRIGNTPEHFNRIVFAVEKGGQSATILLDGPGKQLKIMRFKAKKAIFSEEGYEFSGGYATHSIYY